MRKRFLLPLLVLLMTTLSTHAYDFQSGKLYYNITSANTVEVTYQKLDSYTNYKGLTTVTIPETVTDNGTTYSVTSIGHRSFMYCSSLTSITIPNSVTSIKLAAFYSCSSLTSITIPNSVTSIGIDVFHNCSSLPVVDNLRYADTYLVEAVDKSLSTYSIKAGTKWIGYRAFQNCTSLTSITIPNSVTSIGDFAFSGCSSLPVVDNVRYADTYLVEAVDESLGTYTIRAGTKWIGDYAFYGCSSLTSITIPNSVTSIGYRSFSGCSSLTSITIPNSVSRIGQYAFSGCSALTSITLPESVTSIGEQAFYGCSALTYLTLPNSVTSIGDYTFYGCSALTSITIPNSVTSIGKEAFENCISIISITIPNSVTSIGNYAFYNVPNIVYSGEATGSPWGARSVNGYVDGYLVYADDTKTKLLACNATATGEISIPNSVTSIGVRAFYGCSALTSITIPESVTSIGSSAFSGCSALTSIVWNAKSCGVTKWERDYYGPFANISSQITSFTIGAEVDSIPDYLCYGMSSITSITIPNSVTSIGKEAFNDCTSLTSITIPNSVTSIGKSTFENCSALTSITLPESVTSIGQYAFYDCSALTSITIPNSVTSIGDYAFSSCTSLTSVILPNSVTSIERSTFSGCSSLTSITIPNSVTSIGYYAFSSCTSLTSVTIPESVTSIGYDAFYNCTSLTSVTIPNSVTSIGTEAFYNVPNIVYSGEATGSPWGAKSINGYVDGYLVYADETKTKLLACNATATGEISIPNSVTSIGVRAFYGCSSLTSITIPESVTSIGNYAFKGCSSLTSIVWNAKSCGVTTWETSSDYYGPFANISSQITSFTIGAEVDSIPDYLCYGMDNLTSITIPESVTSIGKEAFNDCSSLTSVVWNAKSCGVTTWKNVYYYYGPFANISSQITSFTIGAEVDSIPNFLCYGMNKLTSITIHNSVTSIGGSAFNGCSSLTSVTLPESITSIGNWAFYDCSSLTSITIPNSVTSIGEGAFNGCSSLTSVIWTAKNCGVTEWKTSSSYYYGPFANISSQITSFIIGAEVDSIPDYLCYGMSSLTSVTIPNSVTSIGKSAFEFCSALTSVTSCACNPPVCGNSVFYKTPSKKTLIVPSISLASYKNSSTWKTFTSLESIVYPSITVQSSDSTLGVAQIEQDVDCDSVAIIAATPNIGYHFTQWTDGNTDNPRTIKLTQDTTLTAEFAMDYSGKCGDDLYWAYSNKEVKITGTGAMYNYTDGTMPWRPLRDSILSVHVANTATSIGACAFTNTRRLATLHIGAGIEDIGAKAFAGCTRLYDIYCYPTYPPFAESNSFANYNVTIYVPCNVQGDYARDIVWGEFKYIECIGSEDVVVPDNEVTVSPNYEDATFTWPIVSGADTYSLVLTKEGDTFCTLVFNAQGQLVSIAFKPARQSAPAEEGTTPATYAEMTANGFRFTVTGLDEGTDYAYTLTVRNAANSVLETYTGEFTTLSNTPTGISDSPDTNETVSDKGAEKLLRDGQVVIIRNGETYDMMGQRL